MSVKALTWAWSQKTGHQSDKAVLMCLADWSSDHGQGLELCWHAQATIAERAECSSKTVERALKRLEENGLIKRVPRYSATRVGGRTTDLIVLCVPGTLTDILSDKDLTDNLSDLNRQIVGVTLNRTYKRVNRVVLEGGKSNGKAKANRTVKTAERSSGKVVH